MREKRLNQVSTRLTDKELRVFEKTADKRGMLPATLLRVALLDWLRIQGVTIPKDSNED